MSKNDLFQSASELGDAGSCDNGRGAVLAGSQLCLGGSAEATPKHHGKTLAIQEDG